jgi:transcription termination/antitermination protein NusA
MNRQLKALVEYYQVERKIDHETIIAALERAIANAAKKWPEAPEMIEISIDRDSYDIHARAELTVVEGTHPKHDEIALFRAREIVPDAKPGDKVVADVPPPDFGRIGAQVAKQSILQAIRQAEKANIYEAYKDRIGEIVDGSVDHFDRSDVYINLGHAEAVMPQKERVPTEEYQIGERISGIITSVDSKIGSTDIVMSRSHPDFVRRLFEREVSEIADGTVEIKGIAREAGHRTKLAVASNDDKVDPVGACVGMRGMRVKNIVNELSGEKVDIVRWDDNMHNYVANSLAPAKLSKIELDEETRTVTVTVDPDQLSLAIGKRGQNARLTSKLTRWRIDIRKSEEFMNFEEKVAQAIERLAAVEPIGHENAIKLVEAGFLTIEGILAASLEDLTDVEGFDTELAEAIHLAVEKAYEEEHGPIKEQS